MLMSVTVRHVRAIIVNNKQLMFSHWARSGIIHISDIINNGILLENNIYDSLQNKAGLILRYKLYSHVYLTDASPFPKVMKILPQKMIPY